jgi:hypothetical protein
VRAGHRATLRRTALLADLAVSAGERSDILDYICSVAIHRPIFGSPNPRTRSDRFTLDLVGTGERRRVIGAGLPS